MFKLIENILAVVVLVTVFGVIMWLGSMAYAAAFGPEDVAGPSTTKHPRPEMHQVLPGESLWVIAREYYPEHHTGEMVYEIRKLNGLTENATIYPNQVLKLPEVG